ncbi:MAG: helix-turn-helix transcriptional regulator [Prevotella sp.]|nr:helix-turn-helix transcriptional regulator [Prevotella sp.]
MASSIESEGQTCPIRQVVNYFGDKWSFIILHTLFSSGTPALRYSEIKRTVHDCSPKMLSATLRNLEAIGLITRKIYPEVPPRVEYALTEHGLSLIPYIVGLTDWVQNNIDNATNSE